MTTTTVKTITVHCHTCDTPVVSIHGDIEYIDPEGEITAYCAKHT